MYILVATTPNGPMFSQFLDQLTAFEHAKSLLEMPFDMGDDRKIAEMDEFGVQIDLLHVGEWGMKVLTNEDIYGAPVQPH